MQWAESSIFVSHVGHGLLLAACFTEMRLRMPTWPSVGNGWQGAGTATEGSSYQNTRIKILWPNRKTRVLSNMSASYERCSAAWKWKKFSAWSGRRRRFRTRKTFEDVSESFIIHVGRGRVLDCNGGVVCVWRCATVGICKFEDLDGPLGVSCPK